MGEDANIADDTQSVGQGLAAALEAGEPDCPLSLPEKQLVGRTQYLELLISALDNSSAHVQRLYDGYMFAHKHGLKESDLVSRGDLSSTVYFIAIALLLKSAYAFIVFILRMSPLLCAARSFSSCF